MKFTNGFWLPRPGIQLHYARQSYSTEPEPASLTITAPEQVIRSRGDALNIGALTVTLAAVDEGVIRVRVVHHFELGSHARFVNSSPPRESDFLVESAPTHLTSGQLSAVVTPGGEWGVTFAGGGRPLTAMGPKSVAWADVAEGAHTDRGPAELPLQPGTHVLAQLDLGVGEVVYGLGERFGPVVKNGQTVEIWNADGGTSSEQAYKNVPFYLTNRGYGVFVNEPGHVSFEVGSEAVERVQFSVRSESLEYFLIYGPAPKDILERYTRLTGRPARVPAWSYGPWLSTSFTTDYNEREVDDLIRGMRSRDLPLSVFHFDTGWMDELTWCDFQWSRDRFPQPEEMIRRIHSQGIKVCVWINPYIAQRSVLFEEGARHGYFIRRTDGTIWQTDLWQPGMAAVDFTNSDAVRWYQGKLRALLEQGVDAFKTDFGERLPPHGVEYADGSDPEAAHNRYAVLYHRAVFDLLEEVKGAGEAVLFSRAASSGDQRYPIHWSGDTTASYASMAESLRGGLSLAYSGFAYWSHDIGGFEGTPDPDLFKRWTAFGLLSSHSRFHGSESYRVPWIFDQDESLPDSAVNVTRFFSKLKNRMAPYLLAAGAEAEHSGIPLMRPMQMEFPDDPAATHLERQYVLGPDLLVAPVLGPDGNVEFYLPEGRWVSMISGERVEGGRWVRENHSYLSLPLYVRPQGIIPLASRDDRPDVDHLDGLTLFINPSGGPTWSRTLSVLGPGERPAHFTVERSGELLSVRSDASDNWNVRLPEGVDTVANRGRVDLRFIEGSDH